MSSRTQIVATIGPASGQEDTLLALVEGQMDVARFNFQWFVPERALERERIALLRSVAASANRKIPVIADLPGPRVQLADGHTYDKEHPFTISELDEAMVHFCVEEHIEYIALSFVGSARDVEQYRDIVRTYGGSQKLIAKIERKVAVEAIDSILGAADAIMVARGDLGNEIPIEEIPFIQKMLIAKANAAGKPVIVATQMLLSMTEHTEPTRAEVTDVEEAVMQGADAVMLSEETASGKHPREAVEIMERILVAAESHRGERALHTL